MIQSLAASALQNLVPFSVILGMLEPGASTAASRQDWKMIEVKADWRPAGKSEFFVGRLVAQTPLPSFDAAEIASGISGGRGGKPRRAFVQGNQHRIIVRVPQAQPFVSEDYMRDREVVVEALNLFERLSAEQRFVRILAIPSVYSVTGGAGTSEQAPVYTTQHCPIALEDATTGDILWVHPEAEHLAQGGRLGGGIASAAPIAGDQKGPVQPRPISQESAKPSASKPKVASPAWYIALKAQVQDLGIPENRQQSAIVKFRAGQLAVAAGAPPERKEDFISQANEEVKGAEAGPVVYPAWYTAMEEELTDLGVPQERMEPAIIKLRAKQLQSEKGLTSEAALLAADKDVKQALRGAPAIPEWVSKVLAEAKELGIPEANHATFLVSQRTLQLGNTPEAKVQAAKEVEEALRHAPQPLLPAQGVSTKPQEAAKTKPAPQTPGAVQDQHPARVQAGDELQTLQKFIDDQQITKKDVANLVGQDPSWVTRILQGTRGKTMGLREKVRNQIVAINAALTEGTNLPVPLPKSERHRRARGGEAGAIPEGSGGALQLVEV